MFQWQDIVGFFKDNWAVLKSAPLAFVLFGVAGVLVGYLLSRWYYSKRLDELGERINTRDDQIARYRVALGIDKASQGALIELTNEELRAKALSTAGALRSFEVGLRNETESLVRGAKDDKDKAERSLRVLRNKSDEFDRTMKSDAVNVDTELRRRLGPQAVASIVGLPPTFYSASDGAPIGITSLLPSGSGMSAGFAGVLADGIEQMARILPVVK